jgi:NAD(P)-dependent dehydrogenase (short-subunit alcohol dehydrogenase family)
VGGSGGIGAASARAFVAVGARVVLAQTAHSAEVAATLAASLPGQGHASAQYGAGHTLTVYAIGDWWFKRPIALGSCRKLPRSGQSILLTARPLPVCRCSPMGIS